MIDSAVSWFKRIAGELTMNKEKQMTEDEQWDLEENTTVFEALPEEPTRRMHIAEINAQLAQAFGSSEDRTIVLEPEVWFDVDYVDSDEDTSVG